MGPPWAKRSDASSPKFCWGFITRDYRRVAEVAFRGRLCAEPSLGREFRAKAHPRQSASRSINRIAEDISMAKLLTLLLEVTGLFRHADPARTDPAAKDHGGGRRRLRAVFDPKASTSGKFADPVVREWIERNLGAPLAASRGANCPARAISAGLLSGLPGDRRTVRSPCWSSSRTMTREGPHACRRRRLRPMGRAEGRKGAAGAPWALWIIAVTFIGILVAVRQI